MDKLFSSFAGPGLLSGFVHFFRPKYKDFSRTFQDPSWKFQGLFSWNLPQIKVDVLAEELKKIGLFWRSSYCLEAFWRSIKKSRTENQFQGLSRPWIFILRFKDFQGVCEPCCLSWLFYDLVSRWLAWATGGGGGGGDNPLYGEAPPERGTFFRLQVYKREEISQV